MEGGKRTLILVVLVVVVIAALVYVAKQTGILGGPKPSATVMGRRQKKISRDTLEIVELTRGEWDDLGHKDGKYKNPKTGNYDMVTPMTCPACGALVPPPDIPSVPKDKAERTKEKWDELEAKRIEIMRNYRCPKCGAPMQDMMLGSGAPGGPGEPRR